MGVDVLWGSGKVMAGSGRDIPVLQPRPPWLKKQISTCIL
ncbi:hypothetical protein HMPREF9141_0556 [Prevotella multiformis DSM 16608]|uniref:Uncharacterized protein n=1 Tax=Prevotella multiformis DSM 16608 TaxID=888743 RepID=F0F4P0_9BACT|nr:hypothetical protein HMPREF9141_0556 [Prevotella multiformis DSM 16608]